MSDQAFKYLGLHPTATPEEVKDRWRELLKTHHPDQGGDAESFKVLRAAYQDAYQTALETPCSFCDGTGTTKIYGRGFSPLPLVCNVCEGSGQKY